MSIMSANGASPRRPVAVAIISLLYVIAGVAGLWHHAADFRADRPFDAETLWVLFVRLLAIVFGVALFQGANWGRWGVIAWMAYHVVLSAFHPVSELLVHAAILGIISCVLFRPSVTKFCRRPTIPQPSA